MHKGVAAAIITGSLLTGGAVGTALFGPSVATAQSSSSSDSSTSSDAPAAPPDGPGRPHGPHGARLNPTVAANAIGISEADLKTALQSGQSLAEVATAHGVDPQTVIDALVADAQAKLAEQVSSGEITQAEADERSADLVQRITDHVNHAGGPGGAGCPGMDGSGPPADQGSSSSGSDSSGS